VNYIKLGIFKRQKSEKIEQGFKVSWFQGFRFQVSRFQVSRFQGFRFQVSGGLRVWYGGEWQAIGRKDTSTRVAIRFLLPMPLGEGTLWMAKAAG